MDWLAAGLGAAVVLLVLRDIFHILATLSGRAV